MLCTSHHHHHQRYGGHQHPSVSPPNPLRTTNCELPTTTAKMPGLVAGAIRKKRKLPGVMREDSDDELGTDDLPWEWIYDADPAAADDAAEQPADEKPAPENARKRKRPAPQQQQIVGARMGSFECFLGDTLLLKAEQSSEAWVGIICDFLLDEEGEKAAHFMWFSSAHEIRNPKKRTDFLEVGSGPSTLDNL